MTTRVNVELDRTDLDVIVEALRYAKDAFVRTNYPAGPLRNERIVAVDRALRSVRAARDTAAAGGLR